MSAADQHYIDTGHKSGIDVTDLDGFTWVECEECDRARSSRDRVFVVVMLVLLALIIVLLFVAGADLSEQPLPNITESETIRT